MQPLITPFVSSSMESWRRDAWLVLLIVATIILTRIVACAMPFAALAAAAALSLSLRHAVIFMFAAWLTNQAVGFGLMGYPQDNQTFIWGGAMGVCTIVSVLAAHYVHQRFGRSMTQYGALATALVAAFVGFQGTLAIANLMILGNLDAFTFQIKAYIALLNIVGLAGICVLNRVAVSIGLLPNTAAA